MVDADFEDFTKIQDLDFFEFQRPWSPEAWRQVSEHFENYSLISLLHQKEIIGFSLWQTNDVDSFAHLLKIIIKKKFRSSGYGFLLLNHSLNLLKTKKPMIELNHWLFILTIKINRESIYHS